MGRSGNTLIKITRLEEKETDKEEGPRHQFVKPKRTSPESAHTDTMQDNHPQNTESAQQVKSMIPFFHTAKVHKNRIIGIIMNYEL